MCAKHAQAERVMFVEVVEGAGCGAGSEAVSWGEEDAAKDVGRQGT